MYLQIHRISSTSFLKEPQTKCGMYAKEYKARIAHKSIRPKIVETLETFKDFWSSKISLVKQTTIPANLHGYGMAAVNNNNTSVVSYGESIATLEPCMPPP
jgi:hypothetical protein